MEQFDFNNTTYLNELINRVIDSWSPPVKDMEFRRLYVEAIIRQNSADNDMQFTLTQNGQLCSIAFASSLGEHSPWTSWWQTKFNSLPQEFQKPFSMSKDYLTFMDEKTYSYMNKDDVKLSLFMSTKPGYGKKILDQAMTVFKSKGFKNMYLWTDCDCNVDWYITNGYELVEEGTYEPFSDDEPYKTFVFRKGIGGEFEVKK